MKRLAILVQFDVKNSVPPFIRVHLEKLRDVADRVVLVSNSPVDDRERFGGTGLYDRLIERQNIGLDFAGWRDALAEEDMTAWDAVILTNSSVIGPLHPLGPIVEQMESRAVDFWGMVLSRHKKPHLQSYFIAFGADVVRSQAWRDFWSGVENLEDKQEIIDRYEVGLTGYLQNAGFRCSALVPNPKIPDAIRLVRFRQLGKLTRVPWNINYINRSVFFYDELINLGMPYLKASLITGKDRFRFKGTENISTSEYSKHAIGSIYEDS